MLDNPHPANTARWNDAVLLLGQRRNCWANIKTSLFQRVVLAGQWQRHLCIEESYLRFCDVVLMLAYRVRRWPNLKSTLARKVVTSRFSGVCWWDIITTRFRARSRACGDGHYNERFVLVKNSSSPPPFVSGTAFVFLSQVEVYSWQFCLMLSSYIYGHHDSWL